MHAVLIGNGFTDIINVYFSSALRDLFGVRASLKIQRIVFPESVSSSWPFRDVPESLFDNIPSTWNW